MALVINDVNARVTYTATSGQTDFTVPFEFFAVTDLVVYINGSLATYAVSPANATEYSVTGAGSNGTKKITVGSPGVTLDQKVVIYRSVTIERQSDFPSSGPFVIETLNTDLDQLVALVQDRRDVSNRSLRLALSDVADDMDALPAKTALANKMLGFDADGEPVASTRTLAQIESGVDDALTAQAAAEAAQTAAEAAQTAAEAGQTAAEAAQTAAETAQANAETAETNAETAETNAEAAYANLLAAGIIIRNGSGVPSSGLGNDGDFYLDTAATTLYGPKAAGAWGSGTSLIGPAGAGTGDMVTATYDPGGVNADAFALSNMTGDSDDIAEGAANLFMSVAEAAKLAAIEAVADVTDATNVAAAGAAMLSTEDQTLAGGARVTTKDLGNLSGNTITPDPGDRPIQKITNNGAGTVAPGSNQGSYLLVVKNTTGAGAITTSGWGKVSGDEFGTATTAEYLCHCVVVGDFSSMIILEVTA